MWRLKSLTLQARSSLSSARFFKHWMSVIRSFIKGCICFRVSIFHLIVCSPSRDVLNIPSLPLPCRLSEGTRSKHRFKRKQMLMVVNFFWGNKWTRESLEAKDGIMMTSVMFSSLCSWCWWKWIPGWLRYSNRSDGNNWQTDGTFRWEFQSCPIWWVHEPWSIQSDYMSCSI